MKRRSRVLSHTALSEKNFPRCFTLISTAMLALCLACGHDDMRDQPSWKPQESEVLLPADSISTAGLEKSVAETEEFTRLVNPIPPAESSVNKGKVLFERFCVPCHGIEAKGGGMMAAHFGEPPSLSDPSNLQLPDGFFYSAMRHGRGLMPELAEALLPEERWHVINYLRRLQSNDK
ncbi:MAG: c-type cytochrome [Acidobacteria bacterium]|nr:c-type cytochrome [Acidobacteriota bacterium]